MKKGCIGDQHQSIEFLIGEFGRVGETADKVDENFAGWHDGEAKGGGEGHASGMDEGAVGVRERSREEYPGWSSASTGCRWSSVVMIILAKVLLV